MLLVHLLSIWWSIRYNDNKGKRKYQDNTKSNPSKKSKLTCWKYGKSGHLRRDCKDVKIGNTTNVSGISTPGIGSNNHLKGQNMFNKSFHIYYVTYISETYFVQDDDVAWWVDNGATIHVCKDRCWFKTYKTLNNESILSIVNESTTLVHGRGCVDLKFSYGKIVSLFNVLHVHNNRKNLVSSSVLNNCGYKQVIESNKFVLSKHGHVHFRKMQDMSNDGLIPVFDMDTEKCKTWMLTKITKKPFQGVKHETEVLEMIHSDLCDLHATPSLGNKKYFVNFIDDASRNAIFDENRISSIPKPSQRSLINETDDDLGILEVLDEVPEEVVVYVETGPKTFDEAMKSQDVAFWKEAINDEMDSIMGNNTRVLADLPLGCKWIFERKLKLDGTIKKFNDRLVIQGFRQNLIIYQIDVKTTFLNGEFDKEAYMNKPQGFIMSGNKNKVDMTKEFLSSRFFIKDMREADVIIMSTPMDTSEKLVHNNGKVVSQLKYSWVIGYLMYVMNYTRPDITFAVGKLSGYTSNPSTQHWQAIQWASKKQTCITSSTTESKFMALVAADKEAEWLKNLILEILLWSKLWNT
ncbi:zinc finger, CCHC-type containing protein [Tanacetum coccineum]